jgi:hypothetical protein
MSTQVLRGKIEALGLVDVFAYLGRNQETGVLNVTRGEIKKAIVVNEGNIIFARSNQVEDRLGDMLLARGAISREQFDQGTALIYEKGYRHGRALVEIGAISPKLLWHAIREQIHNIALSIIPWDTGQFEFVRQEIKRKESITLQLPIIDLVLDVVRNLDNTALIKMRFADVREIYAGEDTARDLDGHLEPHENHILHFIDSRRSVAQICEISDYGETETLRVMYLLRLLGRITAIAAPDAGVATHPLIAEYNKLFAYIHQYLGDRVGTVGTNLLRKYFEDVRRTQPLVFAGVKLLAEGKLSPGPLQKNIDRLANNSADAMLDEALSEFLNLGVLAVKKVLGTEHEAEVIREISSAG